MISPNIVKNSDKTKRMNLKKLPGSKLPNSKLIDRHNRRIDYLRISITDRCNLRCIYCAPNAFFKKLPHQEILRYEEILHIVRIGVRLGISKVRVTGGEPLARKGVYNFLRQLVAIDGLSDVSLTTNGVFLKNNVKKLESAGIKRINISLDTLKRKKFKQITGYDLFDQVWEGIILAYKNNIYPIKINVVVLNGINDDELKNIAELTFLYPFQIRFIEYMPVGFSYMKIKRHLLGSEIENRISSLGKLIPVEKDNNDGPAQHFKFKNAKGEIGLICPVSRPFCHECNRLRLTADGRLRPCLLSDHHEDIKKLLRKGCSDTDLADIIIKAVSSKPFAHSISPDHPDAVPGRMYAIGG